MKRSIALLLATLLCLTALASCAQKPAASPEPADTSVDPASPTDSGSVSTDEPTEDPSDSTNPASVTYPLITDGSVTVEYWMAMTDKVLQEMETSTDLLLYREMEKITGVKVDLRGVSQANANTDFTLMLTAEDYPDLWINFEMQYKNGMDHAIEEEVIVPLNDYLESCMPNLYAIMQADEDIRKQSLTDEGNFPAIPMIRTIHDGADPMVAWTGYVVRQDWLDELNMDVPETYDELEDVLAAMKTNYASAKYPLHFTGLFPTPVLYGGYNISDSFYQVDGEVKFGPLEDGYRDYLMMIADWYQKGYIRPDFNGTSEGWVPPWLELAESTDEPYGVFNMIYTWYDSYKTNSPSESFNLTGLQPLKINKGDTVHIGTLDPKSQPRAAISTASEHVELLCKWWDYLFSPEGIILGNWGVEGETYEVLDDGSYTWIGPFLNPENDPGFDLSHVQWKNLVYNFSGYYEADREFCMIDEKAMSFLDAWDACEKDYVYPSSSTTMTAEENENYSSKYADISTYVTEQTNKFVVGERDFSEWDDFVNTIREWGIDELIGYKQAALDRYNNR